MKLLVCAPAYWATESEARDHCWLYLRSCSKWGITPYLYGIGADRYMGETVMRMDGLIECLATVGKGYSHVLFTDAWDVIFTGPLAEIQAKYEAMGSPPCLAGAAASCMNIHPDDMYDSYFDMTQPQPYLTPALLLGEVDYIRSAFERMDRSKTHDQSPAIMQGWVEVWFKPLID
jgi:hypothetical protein